MHTEELDNDLGMYFVLYSILLQLPTRHVPCHPITAITLDCHTFNTLLKLKRFNLNRLSIKWASEDNSHINH